MKIVFVLATMFCVAPVWADATICIPASGTYDKSIGVETGEAVDLDVSEVTGEAVSLTGDIALNDEATLRVAGSLKTFTLSGKISGTGDLEMYGGHTRDRLITGSASAFVGTISVLRGVSSSAGGYLKNSVYVYGDFPGTLRFDVEKSLALKAGFRPTGYSTGPTSVSLGALAGGDVNSSGDGGALLQLYVRQTLSIDTWNGAATLVCSGSGGNVVRIGSVSDGSTIQVYNGCVLELGTVGANVTVRYCSVQVNENSLSVAEGELGKLDLGASGAEIRLAGATAVDTLLGKGSVTISDGGSIGRCASTVSLSTKGDLSLGGGVKLKDVLGDLPALWLDASKADSMNPLYPLGAYTPYRPYSSYFGADRPAVVYSNDYPVIDAWYDCRPDQRDLYCYNGRAWNGGDTPAAYKANFYPNLYPYVVTNGIGGKPFVSFGRNNGVIDARWGIDGANGSGTKNENRRLPFSKPLSGVQTMFFVFNASLGGGTAIVGGWQDSNRSPDHTQYSMSVAPKFARSASSLTGAMLNTDYATWADGSEVGRPTVEKFSGNWQIITIEGNGETVASLGKGSGSYFGGQQYAEVILYTNVLSRAQRQAVESYLAAKWGVSNCPSAPAAITAASGATVTAAVAPSTYSGFGKISVGGEMIASGYASGEVTLEHAKLTIPTFSAVATEAQISETEPLGWFDAADVGSRTVDGDYLCGLADRRHPETGYVLIGPKNSSVNRRGHIASRNDGFAPVRDWLEMTEIGNVYNGGNVMALNTDHTKIKKLESIAGVDVSMKTIIAAVDSTLGGGTLFTDTAGSGATKATASTTGMQARYSTDPTVPLWPAKPMVKFDGGGSNPTTKTLAEGRSWLDGVAFDGNASGYTGRPEVLSVETKTGTSFNAKFFGWYGGDSASHLGTEIFGEILVYDKVLTEVERQGIERYLMEKWCGRLPVGETDWRNVVLKGSGCVVVQSMADVPALSGFSGRIESKQGEIAFRITSDDVEGALVMPDVDLGFVQDGKIIVDVQQLPTSGECVLVSAKSIKGLVGWALEVTGVSDPTAFRLRRVNGVLKFGLRKGLSVILR